MAEHQENAGLKIFVLPVILGIAVIAGTAFFPVFDKDDEVDLPLAATAEYGQGSFGTLPHCLALIKVIRLCAIQVTVWIAPLVTLSLELCQALYLFCNRPHVIRGLWVEKMKKGI